MIQNCTYNKLTDIKKTVPNLAMSIDDAMVTGVISATGTELPYTNEESIAEIGNYLHDSIDIAMAAKNLGESLAYNPTSAVADANPKGENA